MLKSNSNNSGSSSSQSAAETTLSNKEQKLLSSWTTDIYINIKTPGSKSLEATLKKYASTNEGRGAQILTLVLTQQEVFKDETKKDKVPLIHYAVIRAMNTPESSERARIRDAIKQMLVYCSKALPLETHPLMILFNNSEESKRVRIKHEFIEILRLFLDCPEIFDIRGKSNSSNIVHAASIFPCGSLFLLLDKRPDMLNMTSTSGGTPLFSAIQHGQTQNAIKMIKELKPDLTHRNNQGGSALTGAVFMANEEVIVALLDQGCPIDADTCFLNHSTPSVLKLLSKSGFFLAKEHVRGEQGLLPMVARHPNPESFKLGFFCLESADGKSLEHIVTPEQMRQSRIIPTTAEIKRLHLSFLEVIEYQKNAKANTVESDHIKNLYTAFESKFPNVDKVTAKIQAVTTAQVEFLDLSALPMNLSRIIAVQIKSLMQKNSTPPA
jgi:ankyrin repeat protein